MKSSPWWGPGKWGEIFCVRKFHFPGTSRVLDNAVRAGLMMAPPIKMAYCFTGRCAKHSRNIPRCSYDFQKRAHPPQVWFQVAGAQCSNCNPDETFWFVVFFPNQQCLLEWRASCSELKVHAPVSCFQHHTYELKYVCLRSPQPPMLHQWLGCATTATCHMLGVPSWATGYGPHSRKMTQSPPLTQSSLHQRVKGSYMEVGMEVVLRDLQGMVPDLVSGSVRDSAHTHRYEFEFLIDTQAGEYHLG